MYLNKANLNGFLDHAIVDEIRKHFAGIRRKTRTVRIPRHRQVTFGVVKSGSLSKWKYVRRWSGAIWSPSKLTPGIYYGSAYMQIRKDITQPLRYGELMAKTNLPGTRKVEAIAKLLE